MSKIDRYLIQSLRSSDREAEVEGRETLPGGEALGSAASAGHADGTRGTLGSKDAGTGAPPRFPMLVRIAHSAWTGAEIPGLQVTSKVGLVASCRGTEQALRALQEDPAVISVEASRPLMEMDCSASIPFVGADRVQRPPLSEAGDQCIVAILDTGVDVLHECFLDADGQSRILAIWDQGDGHGPPPPGIGYGREHSQQEIQHYVQTGTVPPSLGRDPQHHGTHVASIAAGRAIGQFAGGMAPECRLLVVKSTRSQGPGGLASLGYSHHHVDALAWVASHAARVGLPVVVNVSQGMNAGAHDGSSLLETAFDEFSAGGRAPGMVVVKSAGNERAAAGHASLSLLSQSIEALEWDSSTASRATDMVELWFDSGDELSFQLGSPSGESTPWVSPSHPSRQGSLLSGNQFDLDLDRLHFDNGDSRLLVKILRGSASAIEPGIWTLRIRGDDVVGSGLVHAWIERDFQRAISFASFQDPGFSLSVPGTAQTVISIGSVAPARPLALARSSSMGPTRDRRQKPDICAPGDGITAARSGTSQGVMAMGGTSMAAPHVSGALALLLSAWEKRSDAVGGQRLNAAQLRAALRNTAGSYNGNWHPGLGYGVLNAEALLRYFR